MTSRPLPWGRWRHKRPSICWTNGGGVFNANSAHPYENPIVITNFLQLIAIYLIPTALCFLFGHVVSDIR
ncbi:potassium-transporting ATPase subunit KdpA [Pseudomonas svalbardensis]|uniref:potassium-transporting ATPase subunit KdpA n=1 Tax=Pseudomonas svalbardensis TaxID=3042029 RepID=UPI0024B36868|nr:potassium-transporting ATPase subunit KdpA [Pseudomonas sp. PMCC200367]